MLSLPAIITDAAAAAVMVLCVVWGAKRGLFKSLIGFVALILALVVAARAADFVTDALIERRIRPATTAAIEARVDELLEESVEAISPLSEMEQVVEAIPNAFIREKAVELLDTLGLSAEATPGYSAREALIETGTQVADTVIDTVVRSLLHTLSYLICFLAASLVLRLLAKLLNLTFKLPGLHGLNALGGGLFGLAEGWLLTALGLWLVLALTDWLPEKLLQETLLARFLLTHSFFSSL